MNFLESFGSHFFFIQFIYLFYFFKSMYAQAYNRCVLLKVNAKMILSLSGQGYMHPKDL